MHASWGGFFTGGPVVVSFGTAGLTSRPSVVPRMLGSWCIEGTKRGLKISWFIKNHLVYLKKFQFFSHLWAIKKGSCEVKILQKKESEFFDFKTALIRKLKNESVIIWDIILEGITIFYIGLNLTRETCMKRSYIFYSIYCSDIGGLMAVILVKRPCNVIILSILIYTRAQKIYQEKFRPENSQQV